MTNTITDLIPIMYRGLDQVAREMVGFIPAVNKDVSAEMVPMGTFVNVPIVPVNTTGDITPAAAPSEAGGQTIPYVQMAITKAKKSMIGWNGEQMKAYRSNGTYEKTLADQFAQAIRALVNEVEADLSTTVVGASRAYGTANTDPFATANDLSDFAQVRKILEDNGAPLSGLRLILGSNQVAQLRGKMTNLFKVNEAGSDEVLRTGSLGSISGMAIGQSQAIYSVPANGNAVMSTAATGFAKGTTDITMTYTSGATVVGDVVTFANDPNKYVVQNVLGSAGVLKIAKPGLMQDTGASARVMTTVGKSALLPAFHPSAIQLLARQPAMPEGGDLAEDVFALTDPVSGLTFQVAKYKQYRQVSYEVGLAWGVKLIKPEFVALLLGKY